MKLNSSLFLLIAYINFAFSNEINVRLSTGYIQGRLWRTKTGKEAFVFKGIPYVEPPIGSLRFAKPVPKSPWSGTVVCDEYKPACHQNASHSRTTQKSMDEDCLYINIFAGVQCSRAKNKCPVVYYIHGGGYEYDSASTWDPDVLIDNFASQDLIYITVGYRVGILGFWSTGTMDAIGNWAIEDMIEGLRWVQREIGRFGGDKTRVTVMGHSSSAMATSLLTMSPKTVGLFHQAVIMSGTSCSASAMNNDVTDYKNLSIRLNCANESDWESQKKLTKVIECMRKVDPQFMVNEFNDLRQSDTIGDPTRITVPRNDGPNGLFPYPLDQLIAWRRPITVLTGTTKNEAGTNKIFNENATGLTVAYECGMIIDQMKLKSSVAIKHQCVREYVFKVNSIAPNDVDGPFSFWSEQTTELYEDVKYFAPCHKEVSSLVSKGSTVYLYSFDYEKAGQEGITPYHSFDLVYVNGLHMFDFDERDKKIQSLYLPLFVNFAKYGNPTPIPLEGVTFYPVTTAYSFNYLSVDIPSEMKPDYHKNGVVFWNYKVPLIESKFAGSYTKYGNNSKPPSKMAMITVFLVLSLILLSFGGIFSIVTKRSKRPNDETQAFCERRQYYETL